MIVKVAGIYFIFFILRFGGFAFSRPSLGKETSQSHRSPPSSAGRDAAALQHRSSLALTKQLPRDQHQHPAEAEVTHAGSWRGDRHSGVGLPPREEARKQPPSACSPLLPAAPGDFWGRIRPRALGSGWFWLGRALL